MGILSQFPPSHELLVILYLVLHFLEMWKCGIVWQSKNIVAVSPSHGFLVTPFLVPHFSEVWKCGIVWQSKDIVAVSPSNEPLVILHLVPHFSEVWKYGIVWQVEFNVALSLSHEKLSALYEHLVLPLYRFLRFSLRTIFFFNRRYNHCFNASCWKKLKVKKPDLPLNQSLSLSVCFNFDRS